jgi:hypothetical protein
MSKRSQDIPLKFLGLSIDCAKLKGVIKGHANLFLTPMSASKKPAYSNRNEASVPETAPLSDKLLSVPLNLRSLMV